MYPVIIRILKTNRHSPEYAELLSLVPDIEEKARGHVEMGYAEGLHREALIATAVVLFVFILLINLSFSALKKKEG